MYRRAIGLTGNGLAERLTALGYEMSRSTIANLETGRRPVTVAELLGLAIALDVPPLVLVLPIESNEPMDLLPVFEVDPKRAALWWRGDQALFEPRFGTSFWDESAELVELIARRHDTMKSVASNEGWSRIALEELREAEGKPGADPGALDMSRRLAASFATQHERDLRYLAQLEADIARAAREERRRLGLDVEQGEPGGVD